MCGKKNQALVPVNRVLPGALIDTSGVTEVSGGSLEGLVSGPGVSNNAIIKVLHDKGSDGLEISEPLHGHVDEPSHDGIIVVLSKLFNLGLDSGLVNVDRPLEHSLQISSVRSLTSLQREVLLLRIVG